MTNFNDKIFGVSILSEDLLKHEEQLAKKGQKFWDPIGEINFKEINARSAKDLAKYHFLKANPKHFSKYRLIWFLIGLSSSLFFWFLDFNVWIPAACFGFTATYLILQNSYLSSLGKNLVRIQLAEKNNWLYDPNPGPNRYKILTSRFPKIFNRGDDYSQSITNEYWGLSTLKQKEYFFNGGLFYYSFKIGDETKTHLNHYLFIRLEKELKSEFLLSPEKKSIFNVFRSKEINTESEEFNKLFEFSYNGEKDEKAVEIVKSLSPAVQLKLIDLAKNKGAFDVLFSKSTVLFLMEDPLLPEMKTNLFKSVEIKTNDAEKVEKEISSLLDIGVSIAKYLN
jgi:hypothetical protein